MGSLKKIRRPAASPTLRLRLAPGADRGRPGGDSARGAVPCAARAQKYVTDFIVRPASLCSARQKSSGARVCTAVESCAVGTRDEQSPPRYRQAGSDRCEPNRRSDAAGKACSSAAPYIRLRPRTVRCFTEPAAPCCEMTHIPPPRLTLSWTASNQMRGNGSSQERRDRIPISFAGRKPCPTPP